MTFSEKVKYFAKREKELVDLEMQFGKEKQLNQAELQLAFGIQPNQPLSVATLLGMICDCVNEGVSLDYVRKANEEMVEGIRPIKEIVHDS